MRTSYSARDATRILRKPRNSEKRVRFLLRSGSKVRPSQAQPQAQRLRLRGPCGEFCSATAIERRRTTRSGHRVRKLQHETPLRKVSHGYEHRDLSYEPARIPKKDAPEAFRTCGKGYCASQSNYENINAPRLKQPNSYKNSYSTRLRVCRTINMSRIARATPTPPSTLSRSLSGVIVAFGFRRLWIRTRYASSSRTLSRATKATCGAIANKGRSRPLIRLRWHRRSVQPRRLR